MSHPTRLVTSADIGDDATDCRFRCATRSTWTTVGESSCSATEAGPDRDRSTSGQETSVQDVVGTAREVVGPDEPFEDRSFQDMAIDHWAHLRDVLLARGITTDPLELRQLPHDVVLSERLRDRLGHD